MVDSTMVGMKWKPIDNITKKQPPSSTSNSISTSATSSVKNAYPGQSPRLLSNGQSAIIQKQQQSNHKHNNNNSNSNNNNSRFRLFSINQFKPHVKKEPIEPALPSITRNASSSSTTTVTNDFDFTGASDKLNKKNDQNNNKKNITQDNTTTPITNNNNNNNDNSNANKIKSKVHIENDNDTDHVETNKLKKKIKKLHNKIDGYKQNEILFRSNTNIITKEILSNQFEISKLHGQLKTLQVNNQNLNSLNNYLINDLITTKIDFQRIRNNLINSLHSNHSTCLVNNRATSITQSQKIDIHDVKDNDNNNDNDQEEEEEEEGEQQQEADQDKQNLPNTSSQNNDMVVTRANLQKLENNIMMRLNQYEDLQNSLENQIKENSHLSKIKDLTIPMESPYIKKLKETIKTYNNDLKSLHAILNNRTANYQILLNKSEKAFAALEQRRNIDVASMRDYIDKSQKYMQNASIYIAKLEKEKNESNILINDLRNNVTQQETKWQKEVAQLKAKLNNINADNNNTNNINTLKANYETKIKKLMQELQVAQNAQKTKQATIVLLNRELSKVKNELLAAHHYQNPNIPNSDTVSEIINSQKKSYESLLDLAKTEHKREMSALKTQYLVLLNQYKQITAKMHQKFNRDSPIIQLLIKEERQRLLHDVQSYLNIISNNPNMRDQIDRTDVFNAINILNMVTSKLLNPPDNLQFQMNQQTQNNINLLQQNTFNNNNNNNNNNNSNQHQRKITVKNNVNNNKNNNLNNNGNANNTAFQQTNMVLAIQDKPENNNNSISTNAIKQNASHTPFYTVHQNVNNTNNSNNNIINTEIDNTINYQNVPNNNKTIINNKITSNNISPDISTNTRITTNTHTTTNNQNTVNTLVPSSFTPINKINDVTINSTSNNFGVVLPTSTTNTLDNNNPISKNNVNKNNEITTTTTNTTTADTNKHIETIKILNKVEKTTSAEKEESSQTISNSSHNPDEIIAPSSLNSFTKETATVSTINSTKTETPLATKGSTPTPTNQGNTNSISNEQEKNSASMPQVQSRKEVVPSTSTISTDTTATTTTTTTTTPINTIETTLTVNDEADNSTS